MNIRLLEQQILKQPYEYEDYQKYASCFSSTTWYRLILKRPLLINQVHQHKFSFSNDQLRILVLNYFIFFTKQTFLHLSFKFQMLFILSRKQNEKYIASIKDKLTIDHWIDILNINPRLIMFCKYADMLSKDFIYFLYQRAPVEVAPFYFKYKLIDKN